MMKNKVITSSAQKLSSKHLSLVPRPSIFSFSLSSFCPFFPKCLSHVINATDFSKISAHPLQHLLESGSMSHSFLTLNLQLLSQNQEMFLVLWLRERELYPCKRLGSLTVTRSHLISLFLSVPICKLGIIASTFHGAARIKWVHSRTAVAYGRHRASPYDVNYCHHYWPLPLHWNILKPLPSFKNKNEKTKTLPWRRFHLSLFSF